MKKVLIVVLMIVIGFFVYSIITLEPEQPISQLYRFEFEEPLDDEFWLVAPWNTFKQTYEMASVRDGILKLSKSSKGIEPYMISKPIEIQDGDVITLKRRVKIRHGSDMFSGGVAMYQTSETETVPEKTDGAWATSFGDGVFLLEYSYDLKYAQERPGRDIFRFLAADWSYNENYALIPPVYNEWVEESYVYDTRSSQMVYTINGKSYKLNSFKLDRPNVRFMMHAYGEGSGNAVEIDWVEISVENKRVKK